MRGWSRRLWNENLLKTVLSVVVAPQPVNVPSTYAFEVAHRTILQNLCCCVACGLCVSLICATTFGNERSSRLIPDSVFCSVHFRSDRRSDSLIRGYTEIRCGICPLSAEEMLHGQLTSRGEVPAHAINIHDGLPQKGLERDHC